MSVVAATPCNPSSLGGANSGAGKVRIPNFGEWKFTLDRDATVAAYASQELGGSESCECNTCRNFRLARTAAFPSEFLTLLAELGIDYRKDAEVYHNARMAPGRHNYAGWFHFVGTLERNGDFSAISCGDDFTAWMCSASAPRLESLEGCSVVQVEFNAEAVPWLLNEPEAI